MLANGDIYGIIIKNKHVSNNGIYINDGDPYRRYA